MQPEQQPQQNYPPESPEAQSNPPEYYSSSTPPALQPPTSQPPQQVPRQQYDEADINNDDFNDGPTQLPKVEPVSWLAPEYLQHDKTPLWYVGFGVTVVLLMIIAVLLMKTWSFAILIPVMAAALLVYTHRPSQDLQYMLTAKGIYINDQLHPMGEFSSFGVLKDPEPGMDLHSLVLIPVKRFRPGLTVYFPTEVGERAVDLLGGYLPMQDLKPDMFDKIVRKLRI